MNTLSIDIISVIFEYLDTKELIWASRTCKNWRRAFIKYLPKYKLNLSSYGDKITDADLFHLKGVHAINLYHCQKITDAGLIHLKGIHTIRLDYCHQITDVGLAHLKGVHNINLHNCYNITDVGLVHLKGVHTIDLCYYNWITDVGLQILKNANPNVIIKR
jgi:hypothetical protein